MAADALVAVERRMAIPIVAAVRLQEMLDEKRAGQVILNINDGRIQSFEVKEHHRVT